MWHTVVDPHHFHADPDEDPDSDFLFDADPDADPDSDLSFKKKIELLKKC